MKHQLEIIPGGFSLSPEEAGRSVLLVHLGLTRGCYSIIDSGSGQVIMVAELGLSGQSKEGVEALIGEHALLAHQFEEVKVSFDTFQFTFIPLIHYNNAFLEDYARFAKRTEDTTAVMNRIPTAGIANVFAINTSFYDALNLHFRHPKIFTQISSFLNGARRISQANSLYNVFLGIKPTVFEIAIIKEEGLQYYNIFRYSNPQEFNYFLLVVIQNFNLTSETAFVTLFGYIDENDLLFSTLKKYFERILFANSETIFSLSPPLRNLQASRYYSLLSLQLCD